MALLQKTSYVNKNNINIQPNKNSNIKWLWSLRDLNLNHIDTTICDVIILN